MSRIFTDLKKDRSNTVKLVTVKMLKKKPEPIEIQESTDSDSDKVKRVRFCLDQNIVIGPVSPLRSKTGLTEF